MSKKDTESKNVDKKLNTHISKLRHHLNIHIRAETSMLRYYFLDHVHTVFENLEIMHIQNRLSVGAEADII